MWVCVPVCVCLYLYVLDSGPCLGLCVYVSMGLCIGSFCFGVFLSVCVYLYLFVCIRMYWYVFAWM